MEYVKLLCIALLVTTTTTRGVSATTSDCYVKLTKNPNNGHFRLNQQTLSNITITCSLQEQSGGSCSCEPGQCVVQLKPDQEVEYSQLESDAELHEAKMTITSSLLVDGVYRDHYSFTCYLESDQSIRDTIEFSVKGYGHFDDGGGGGEKLTLAVGERGIFNSPYIYPNLEPRTPLEFILLKNGIELKGYYSVDEYGRVDLGIVSQRHSGRYELYIKDKTTGDLIDDPYVIEITVVKDVFFRIGGLLTLTPPRGICSHWQKDGTNLTHSHNNSLGNYSVTADHIGLIYTCIVNKRLQYAFRIGSTENITLCVRAEDNEKRIAEVLKTTLAYAGCKQRASDCNKLVHLDVTTTCRKSGECTVNIRVDSTILAATELEKEIGGGREYRTHGMTLEIGKCSNATKEIDDPNPTPQADDLNDTQQADDDLNDTRKQVVMYCIISGCAILLSLLALAVAITITIYICHWPRRTSERTNRYDDEEVVDRGGGGRDREGSDDSEYHTSTTSTDQPPPSYNELSSPTDREGGGGGVEIDITSPTHSGRGHQLTRSLTHEHSERGRGLRTTSSSSSSSSSSDVGGSPHPRPF